MQHASYHTMPSLPAPRRISSADRLGLTLFFAIALHLLIILGIGFEMELPKPHEQPQALEIILVHSHSEEVPDQADYLAQASQRGGGEVEERLRPSSPEYSAQTLEQTGDAAQTQPLAAPPPAPPSPQQEVMVTDIPQTQRVEQRDVQPPPTDIPTPTAAELMQRSREIARLAAEIQQRQQAYAQMPRERSISANTRESIYAAYQDAWRQKVERIGNLNYPDEARRQGMSGALLLRVSIRADGSLADVQILRSSGYRALDEGAVRIVQLAAPYSPFSAEMRQEIDVLHITRVWQFTGGERVATH